MNKKNLGFVFSLSLTGVLFLLIFVDTFFGETLIYSGETISGSKPQGKYAKAYTLEVEFSCKKIRRKIFAGKFDVPETVEVGTEVVIVFKKGFIFGSHTGEIKSLEFKRKREGEEK